MRQRRLVMSFDSHQALLSSLFGLRTGVDCTLRTSLRLYVARRSDGKHIESISVSFFHSGQDTTMGRASSGAARMRRLNPIELLSALVDLSRCEV